METSAAVQPVITHRPAAIGGALGVGAPLQPIGRHSGGRIVRLAVCAILAATIVQLSACGQGAGPGDVSSDDLPATSLAKPFPGCKIESFEPTEVSRQSDGEGGSWGPRVVMLRFEAVCLPDAGSPSPWWQPYRILFEQRFSMPTKESGAPQVWFSGDAEPVSDLQHPSRPVDAATEALGRNCALLLDRIEARTIPCVRTKDPQAAGLLQDALQRYRNESRFTININGENDLEAVRLSRDADCLVYWRQVQRQMQTPLQVCSSN
jgi:hypothetical protein